MRDEGVAVVCGCCSSARCDARSSRLLLLCGDVCKLCTAVEPTPSCLPAVNAAVAPRLLLFIPAAAAAAGEGLVRAIVDSLRKELRHGRMLVVLVLVLAVWPCVTFMAHTQTPATAQCNWVYRVHFRLVYAEDAIATLSANGAAVVGG